MPSRAWVLRSSVWLSNVCSGLSLHQLSPRYMCRTCILPLPLTVPERSVGCFFRPSDSLKLLPGLHLLLPLGLQEGERHLLSTGSRFPTQSSHSQPAPSICTTAFKRINSNVLFHLFIDASSILRGTWLLLIFSAF